MEPRNPGCNIIDILYEASPYGPEGNMRPYTGYRDYYMQVAGYTEVISAIGLTILSTYESFINPNNTNQY